MRKTAATLVAGLVLTTTAACGDTGNKAGTSDTIEYPTRTLQIMAPAGAGGGWDITARTMQKAFRDANLVSGSVEVTNVTGAAGTVGLAQLATKHRGDPHQLMITGLVMVGGIVTNKSAIDLGQTTPIATLTAEDEVIVVPAASPYKTLKDLTGPTRTAGLDAPTLREAGVELEFTNWRGIVAPPGLSAHDARALRGVVRGLVRSAAWRAALARNGWTDAYLGGAAFDRTRRETGRSSVVLRLSM